MPLSLDQFEPWTATFEVRYDTAFLFWDHSGAIWADIKKRFPDVTVDQSSPNQVRLNIDEQTQAVGGVDRALFTVTRPKADLRELGDFSDVFFPTIFKRLDITSLTRVGLRVIYGKLFPDRAAAARFVVTNTSVPDLSGKHMNVDGHVLDTEIVFQYEGDVLGFIFRMKSTQSKMNLSIPVEFQDMLKERKAERSLATIDIDYYAHGVTPVSSFKASALIESWLHLMRRDIGKLFANG